VATGLTSDHFGYWLVNFGKPRKTGRWNVRQEFSKKLYRFLYMGE